jgi:hypothetical protein
MWETKRWTRFCFCFGWAQKIDVGLNRFLDDLYAWLQAAREH